MKNRSENSDERGQILTILQVNSHSIEQKIGEIWTGQPNLQPISFKSDRLLAHGVSIEACYATMKGKGWTAENMLPRVTIIRDAYTRLIDLQQSGYAYIRF